MSPSSRRLPVRPFSKLTITSETSNMDLPLAAVTNAWKHHVMRADGGIDEHAYVFCVLERLRDALRRRDIYVKPSWRYTDPRSGLLSGSEWEAAKPIVCRSLGYTADPEPVLAALAVQSRSSGRCFFVNLSHSLPGVQ